MPRRLYAMLSRLPRGTTLWAGLCLLLALGGLQALLGYHLTAQEEVKMANASGQRAIIDAHTGQVASSTPPETPVPAFEVSNDEPADDNPADTAAPTDAPAPPPAAAATNSPAQAMATSTPRSETTPPPAADTAPPEAASSVDAPALRTQPSTAGLPKTSVTREAIVAPPAPEITEKKDGLLLPKRGNAANATPAALYAKRFKRQPDTAYIAFVLTDAGFNAAVLSPILSLPKEVTVAFSPYALDPRPQIELLHRAGYETWGGLPAQSSRYPQDDPGPLGLIGGQDATEQQARLNQVLAATLGAVGLVLAPDEVLSNRKEFARVLKTIDSRGMLLLSTDTQHSIDSISDDAAMQAMIRRADLVLDATDAPAFVQSKLAALDALAQAQKKLIVVATARPHIVAMLQAWFKQHPYAGSVRLAPLSAMYAADTPPEEEKPAAKESKAENKKEHAH